MTTLDLTDDEEQALLRRALDEARFPLAPRYAPLRAILDQTSRPAAADPPRG